MKSHQEVRRDYRRTFYVLTPVLSAAFSLLLVEGILAVFHPIPHAIEDNMYFEPDPFTGYKLKPESLGFFIENIEGRTNSLGYRDDPVSPVPDPDRPRILVIGDSFTVGANVTQEQAFPQVLEKLLGEARTPGPEIINAGVGGWNPFHYSRYYEHYGRALSPDLVLVGFFVGNDTYSQERDVAHTMTAVLGRRVTRESATNGALAIKIALYEHSNLARLLMTHLNRTAIAYDYDIPRDDCSDFTKSYLDIERQKLSNHLKWDDEREGLARNAVDHISRIKTLTDRDHVPLVVVLIPDELQINPQLRSTLLSGPGAEKAERFDFDMPQPLLAKAFGERAIPVIDLLPYFRADGRCLYMNDTHWDAEGHALAAEVLREKLTELDLVER